MLRFFVCFCAFFIGFVLGFNHNFSLYTAELRNCEEEKKLTLSLNTKQRKLEFKPLLKYPHLFQYLHYTKNGTEEYEYPPTTSTAKVTKYLVWGNKHKNQCLIKIT